MNWVHVHLFLNHVPVWGTVFGALLLGAAVAMQNAVLQKAGLVALILVAVSAVPVYFTGEQAEETVEHLPGVTKPLIEQHEDAAKVSAVALGLLGIVSLAGLVVARRSPGVLPRVAGLSLVLSLAVAGLMFRTAGLGGQIRHSEIRNGSIFSAPVEQSRPASEQPAEHDD